MFLDGLLDEFLHRFLHGFLDGLALNSDRPKLARVADGPQGARELGNGGDSFLSPHIAVRWAFE